MTVIGYLKVIKREELFHMFLSVFFAFMGICFVVSTFKFDHWELKSLECLVKTNPFRSGRSGLVVTVSPLDGKVNIGGINVYFSAAGYPKHPLNDLRPSDKVYVEALFDPSKGLEEKGLGVHLARDGKILFSRDHYYKDHRENKVGSVIIAIGFCCFLLYKLKKHFYHYQHLKKKRKYNVT